MSIVIAVVLVLVLFGVNVWLFRENARTPKPEGCDDLLPDCTTCGIGDCNMRKEPLKKEE